MWDSGQFPCQHFICIRTSWKKISLPSRRRHSFHFIYSLENYLWMNMHYFFVVEEISRNECDDDDDRQLIGLECLLNCSGGWSAPARQTFHWRHETTFFIHFPLSPFSSSSLPCIFFLKTKRKMILITPFHFQNFFSSFLRHREATHTHLQLQ